MPYGFAAFDDHLTVGTALNQAGYQTALVGKYLNGYGKQPSPVTGGPSTTYVPDGWTDWKVSIEKRWPAGSPYAGGTYNYRVLHPERERQRRRPTAAATPRSWSATRCAG